MESSHAQRYSLGVTDDPTETQCVLSICPCSGGKRVDLPRAQTLKQSVLLRTSADAKMIGPFLFLVLGALSL